MAGLASMRPAQIAREIDAVKTAKGAPLSSFNEARANCAGNWPRFKPPSRTP